MAKIPAEIEVDRISLNRKLNPAKGWSEWFVDDEYFTDVEDAVAAYFNQTKEFLSFRTSYKVWQEAFSSLDLDKRRLSSKLAELLRSLDVKTKKTLKILIHSTERKGAPDLLLKKGGKNFFVEVKVRDSLSNQQLKWLKVMKKIGLETFIVRVKPVKEGIQLKKNDFIIQEFEKHMLEYINRTETPTAKKAFAHAKRSLTNFDDYRIDSTLEFESEIHKLFGKERLGRTYDKLFKDKKKDKQ